MCCVIMQLRTASHGAAKCLRLIYATVWHFVGSACVLGWQNSFHCCCGGVSSNRFIWLHSVKCKSCCPCVSDYFYFAYLRAVHRHVQTSVRRHESQCVFTNHCSGSSRAVRQVGLYVQTTTFERNYIRTRCLVWWLTLTLSVLCSRVKVIG